MTVDCVPKFCYLGDTYGSGGGVEEAVRARVRCAWTYSKSDLIFCQLAGGIVSTERLTQLV